MKTLSMIYTAEYRKLNKLLLTGGVLTGILAGWLLGSMNAHASAKNEKQKNAEITNSGGYMTLSAMPLRGEILPTMILNEVSVIADQNNKN